MKNMVIYLCTTILIVGYILLSLIIPLFNNNKNAKDIYLCSEVSPDGHYTIAAYMTDDASYRIYADCIDNITGNRRQIYTEKGQDECKIIFTNYEYVDINGHIISLKDGRYNESIEYQNNMYK